MKKLLIPIITAFALSASAAAASASGLDFCFGNEVKLQIDNPMMNACGILKEVDPGRGTAPVIVNDSTLVPIRAVIEALGGEVYWDEAERKVSVCGRDATAIVTIDSTDATICTPYTDYNAVLSTPPIIMDGRTMVPLRFVSESIGLNVVWDANERIVSISEPAGMSAKFANFDGTFYPIGDLLDVRMGANDTVKYNHNGQEYEIALAVESMEQTDDQSKYFDDEGSEISFSSITINGKKYDIPNSYNFEYAGIADLSPDADGFEIIVYDSGVSSDYSVTVYTYNQHGLVWTNQYAGMMYSYYENGTGTVYCDKKGHIINKYIGFTSPMYAYDVNTIMGGDGIVPLDGEYTKLNLDIEGKELVFGRDLFADYHYVDEYPADYNNIWFEDQNLVTVDKGTPVIIDKIVYWTDEEGTDESYVQGYYARIDGKKCVIQLQYAG